MLDTSIYYAKIYFLQDLSTNWGGVLGKAQYYYVKGWQVNVSSMEKVFLYPLCSPYLGYDLPVGRVVHRVDVPREGIHPLACNPCLVAQQVCSGEIWKLPPQKLEPSQCCHFSAMMSYCTSSDSLS